MPTPKKDIEEMKALKVELQDLQERQIQNQIENALLDKRLEATLELEANETKRNVQLKKRLQEAEELVHEEKETSGRYIELWQTAMEGNTLSRMLTFAENQLKAHKDVVKAKREFIDRKIHAEMTELAKANPMVLQYLRIKAENDEYDKVIKRNAEELEALRRKRREANEIRFESFQLAVVDLAPTFLRYRRVIDQMNNPTGSEVRRVNQIRTFMPPMRMSHAPAGATREEGSSQMMSVTPSTSKCQQNGDTNEGPEEATEESGILVNDKTSGRRSVPCAGILAKKSAGNAMEYDENEKTKPSKPARASDSQSSVRQNPRNVARAKETAASLQFKGAVPNSQKPSKPKVTFVNLKAGGSGFEMGFSDDDGVSSSDFITAAANDMDHEISPDNETQISANDENDMAEVNDNEGRFNDDDEMDPESDDQENRYESQDDYDDNNCDWGSIEPNRMSDGTMGSPLPSFDNFDIGSDVFKDQSGEFEATGNNDFRMDDDEMEMFK